MSDATLNLHQKIVEIRKRIDAFTKDTQGYGYKYVSGAQVLKKISDSMNEFGVLLYPSVTNQQHGTHAYKNARGKDVIDFIVHGDMVYKWQNADDPSQVLEVPWQYMGQQDDFSKAYGSALTYSERYFLLKFFNVPTDEDDPDAKKPAGQNKPQGQGQNKPRTGTTNGQNKPANSQQGQQKPQQNKPAPKQDKPPATDSVISPEDLKAVNTLMSNYVTANLKAGETTDEARAKLKTWLRHEKRCGPFENVQFMTVEQGQTAKKHLKALINKK